MSLMDQTLANLLLSDQVNGMAPDNDKNDGQDGDEEENKSLSRESRKYVKGFSNAQAF